MTDRDLLVRIAVQAPPPGVAWALQLGRSDLLPPVKRGDGVEFEVALRVVAKPDGEVDFRGAAVQGPKNGRFIYLNSGTRAGQAGSCWDRRAKVSLEGLRPVLAAMPTGAEPMTCAAAIAGTDKKGGPACASVPLVGTGWKVVARPG